MVKVGDRTESESDGALSLTRARRDRPIPTGNTDDFVTLLPTPKRWDGLTPKGLSRTQKRQGDTGSDPSDRSRPV